MDTFDHLRNAIPSQADLARQLGVGPTTLASWLSRGTLPPHTWRVVREYVVREGRQPIDYADFVRMAEWAHKARRAA